MDVEAGGTETLVPRLSGTCAHTATFLITTARSGTQWVEASLRAAYPDLLVTRHEPVGYAYRPRSTLRDLGRLRRLKQDSTVSAHLTWVHEVIENRSYLETGFPAFAMGPLLREEFGDRLRLVHLTRHPVPVAASVVTHGWFDESRRPEIAEAITPVPTDDNVSFAQYADRWDDMSAFAKALLFWQEVHRFGIEQEKESPPGGFIRMRFEDLVDHRDARLNLARFLGLPERASWIEASKGRVDDHRHQTDRAFDWEAVARFPELHDVAGRVGYAPRSFDRWALDGRYRGALHRRALREFRRLLGPIGTAARSALRSI